jgi:hypothetical protein
MNILITILILGSVALIAFLIGKKQPETIPPVIIDTGNTVLYYGFGQTKQEAYESGLPGELTFVNGIYYKLNDTRADDGVYVTLWADSYDGCRFMLIKNGQIIDLQTDNS